MIIVDLTHATYLGAELTKAELALRVNRPYEQDKPLNQFVHWRSTSLCYNVKIR